MDQKVRQYLTFLLSCSSSITSMWYFKVRKMNKRKKTSSGLVELVVPWMKNLFIVDDLKSKKDENKEREREREREGEFGSAF